MRRILVAGLLAAAVSACGSYGGGSAPAAPAGGALATPTPKASEAANTPAPSGNPDDYYGY